MYRASYRNLLGTAESIIEMDGQIHDVETLIGDIGVKCNTRLIEKKTANLRSWTKEVGAKGTSKLYSRVICLLRAWLMEWGRQRTLRIRVTAICPT